MSTRHYPLYPDSRLIVNLSPLLTFPPNVAIMKFSIINSRNFVIIDWADSGGGFPASHGDSCRVRNCFNHDVFRRV